MRRQIVRKISLRHVSFGCRLSGASSVTARRSRRAFIAVTPCLLDLHAQSILESGLRGVNEHGDRGGEERALGVGVGVGGEKRKRRTKGLPNCFQSVAPRVSHVTCHIAAVMQNAERRSKRRKLVVSREHFKQRLASLYAV